MRGAGEEGCEGRPLVGKEHGITGEHMTWEGDKFERQEKVAPADDPLFLLLLPTIYDARTRVNKLLILTL
jgi:hypothetical protein